MEERGTLKQQTVNPTEYENGGIEYEVCKDLNRHRGKEWRKLRMGKGLRNLRIYEKHLETY